MPTFALCKVGPIFPPRDDVDMIVVRENTEGLYVSQERAIDGGAIAERVITKVASHRIGERTLALSRVLARQQLTIVHKANVLPLTDGLFRDEVRAVAKAYAESGFTMAVDELLVDVAALKMVSEPERFDVVVTTNLFGDILSDAAAHWGGGLGMAPSLNWGDGVAVAEPVHGSAPDIAGKNIANPIAAILSGALLVRYVWENEPAAQRIELAVRTILQESPELIGGYEGATQAIEEAILAALG